MSDRMQRVMAYVIAMAMVTAVAAAPTVAQVVDPEAERVYEVTANADSVDGFSAIGATANKALRARKLVATNKYGQLPSNIIRPRWRELKGVPLGFKDGVDDVGVTGLTVTTSDVASVTIPTGDIRPITAQCPAGTKVIGGNYGQSHYDIRVTDSMQDLTANGWVVIGVNYGAVDQNLYVRAICLASTPSGALASRGNVQPAGKHK